MKGVALWHTLSQQKASFLHKFLTPFCGRASPCITGSSSLKAGTGGFKWSFQSHRNVFTINGILTQISFDLFVAFQLLKNDGVILNEPIGFVPTSCLALVRTLTHIIIWMIIPAILNHRGQLTQRNMATYFFDPVQDITDLDLYKTFNFYAAWLIHVAEMGRFPFCQRFRKFWSKGLFRFLMTRILGVTSGGVPLI